MSKVAEELRTFITRSRCRARSPETTCRAKPAVAACCSIYTPDRGISRSTKFFHRLMNPEALLDSASGFFCVWGRFGARRSHGTLRSVCPLTEEGVLRDSCIIFPGTQRRVSSITIELKPEHHPIIQEEIRNGHFRSADEVLDYALAALREKNSSLKSEPKEPHKNFAQFLME